jgi:nitrite reductase (NADH) small subunit
VAFARVCALDELPANSVIEVYVGDEPYAVCNVNGAITALHGVCPHAGGPLGQGRIDEGGRLVCPFHEWEFDCATGANVALAAIAVPSYPVKVEGGDVFADLP